MNRYWNLSEKKRASLRKEDVESLLSVELMEKGVLRPKTPKLEDEVSIEIATMRVCGIQYDCARYGGSESLKIAFKDEQSAAKFLALNAMVMESEYFSHGSNIDYVTQLSNAAITSLEVHRREDILAAKSAIDINNQIKKRNKELTKEYDDAMKAVEEASEGLWDDWYELRRKVDRFAKVIETHEEYVAMAEGNKDVAMDFLKNAFSEEEVNAALEWQEEE